MGVNAISQVNTTKTDSITVAQTVAKTNSPLPLVNNQSENDTYRVRFDEKGYPIPDGKTLILLEEEKVFFRLITVGAQYIYKANGTETINDIRTKFHIKDGGLRKCNQYIVDAEWTPESGREIYFNKEDIKTGK